MAFQGAARIVGNVTYRLFELELELLFHRKGLKTSRFISSQIRMVFYTVMKMWNERLLDCRNTAKVLHTLERRRAQNYSVRCRFSNDVPKDLLTVVQ